MLERNIVKKGKIESFIVNVCKKKCQKVKK